MSKRLVISSILILCLIGTGLFLLERGCSRGGLPQFRERESPSFREGGVVQEVPPRPPLTILQPTNPLQAKPNESVNCIVRVEIPKAEWVPAFLTAYYRTKSGEMNSSFELRPNRRENNIYTYKSKIKLPAKDLNCQIWIDATYYVAGSSAPGGPTVDGVYYGPVHQLYEGPVLKIQ